MSPNAAQASRRSPVAHQQRTHRERQVVGVVLLTAAVAVIALAAVTVRASVVASDVQQRASGALNRASLLQMEFHTQHRRFALWDELSARGMRLPSSMRMEVSTATPSHWYLRLRDVPSGITCDRVGMLTDPPGRTVLPECVRPK